MRLTRFVNVYVLVSAGSKNTLDEATSNLLYNHNKTMHNRFLHMFMTFYDLQHFSSRFRVDCSVFCMVVGTVV